MEEYKIVGDKIEKIKPKEVETFDAETVYNEDKQELLNLEYELRQAQEVVNNINTRKAELEARIEAIEDKIPDIKDKALEAVGIEI